MDMYIPPHHGEIINEFCIKPLDFNHLERIAPEYKYKFCSGMEFVQ